MSTDSFVRVRGAREHNLKNIDVDIPRHAIVVFTGVSGSGKSSLAFSTLYAEAQRRYLESVAPYARRLFHQLGVPQVDRIEGLPPAVALQQQRGSPTTRSSVGSVTTLSNLLRMLYSRAGQYPEGQPLLYAESFSPNTPEGACPRCHGLGRVYDATEASMVPDDSLSIRDRAIAAWPLAWQGQNLRDIVTTLGFDIDLPWRELKQKDRTWLLFTDEQPIVPVYAGFNQTEVRAAMRRKDEPSYMGTFTGAKRYLLHTFANSQSALMKKRVSRYLVSAACDLCQGKRLGQAALTVTFADLDIAEISALPLKKLAELFSPALNLKATTDKTISTSRRGTSAESRENIGALRKRTAAQRSKNGSSKKESLTNSPLTEGALKNEVGLTKDLEHPETAMVIERIGGDLCARLEVLLDLGLGYLSLDRSTPSLSPGELQRLRLATQVHSNLFGVVYVLDEPSAGLHPVDTESLMRALHGLKASGNSLFVVEHELDVIRQADWIVDVGPGAGEHGGHVLYSGPPDGLRTVDASQTRRYLFATAVAPAGLRREASGWLKLKGVTRNNLVGVDVAFPLKVLSSITGVSGSGKSTLVSQALVELMSERLGQLTEATADDDQPAELDTDRAVTLAGRIVAGAEQITRLVQVDQKPIGRTPRSNLATYTGLFDHVRRLFAATPAARQRGYDAGRFSFNVAEGRCQKCEGEGFVFVELLFLPSVYAPCPACHGARYNSATLEIQVGGKSIADILALTVDTACDFFQDQPALLRSLAVLRSVGLGYLRLGQPATELSGGEAQRIKLATELQRAQRGHTLYVLDEPTTGLHPNDTEKLLAQLEALVDAGNTVILVEHDMQVIARCDWVIDMGPGAGDEGGRIVAAGTPQQIAKSRHSKTAIYLSRALSDSAIN